MRHGNSNASFSFRKRNDRPINLERKKFGATIFGI